jgi:hypothetical protein
MTNAQLHWKSYWRQVTMFTGLIWGGSLLMIPMTTKSVPEEWKLWYILFYFVVLITGMCNIPRAMRWMNEPTREIDRIARAKARQEEVEHLKNWEMPGIGVMLLRLIMGLPLLALAFCGLALWGIIGITPMLAAMALITWLNAGEIMEFVITFTMTPLGTMAILWPPTAYTIFMEKPAVQERIDAFFAKLPKWAQ